MKFPRLPRLLGLAALLQAPLLAQNNILVIVADDLGVDRVGAYAEHPDPGRTPNVDALAAQGLMFRNAYSNPLCTPTRATLLTGRYGFRTGMGINANELGGGPELSLDERILPEILVGYSNAALGKWHLGHYDLHPNDSGFDHFAGTLRNLDRLTTGASYTLWTKLVNGATWITTEYATTDTANETVAAIQTLPEPWFVYSCFHAAHTPTHAPPSPLHTYPLAGDPDDDPPLFTRAMVEALDTEIGRVLAATPPNTIVFFIGDNGTADLATDPPTPAGHNKGTLFEGGVNVPFIVAGPGIALGESAGLINTTDLYATVAELAGVPSQAEDSISLVPYFSDPGLPSLRQWVFSERFGNEQNSRRAIRGERYKLIRNVTDELREQFFDLETDPTEQVDLLDGTLTAKQQAAYERLRCAMPPGVDYQSYCAAVPNSTGQPATLSASGSNLVLVEALCLRASDLPVNQTAYFLAAMTQDFVPQPGGSAGNMCLGGQIGRFAQSVLNSGPQGEVELYVDITQIPTSPIQAVQPGETWHFQCWYRDGVGSNFSDGVSILFQ